MRLTLAGKLHPFACMYCVQDLHANLQCVYRVMCIYRQDGTTIQTSALTGNNNHNTLHLYSTFLSTQRCFTNTGIQMIQIWGCDCVSSYEYEWQR